MRWPRPKRERETERRDPRLLAAKLVTLLERSRPVPLSDQVRVRKRKADALIEDLRNALGAGFGSERSALLAAAQAVADALEAARPIPLTDEVRLPRAELDGLVERLRAAAG
jgi:hypothetical protein